VTDLRSEPHASQAAYTEGTAPGYVPSKASDKEKIGKESKKVDDWGGESCRKARVTKTPNQGEETAFVALQIMWERPTADARHWENVWKGHDMPMGGLRQQTFHQGDGKTQERVEEKQWQW